MDLDFCGTAVLVMFEADETLDPQAEVTAYINITDDSINEGEQVFMLEMETETILGNSTQQKLYSLCKIIDNDGKQARGPPSILVLISPLYLYSNKNRIFKKHPQI